MNSIPGELHTEGVYQVHLYIIKIQHSKSKYAVQRRLVVYLVKLRSNHARILETNLVWVCFTLFTCFICRRAVEFSCRKHVCLFFLVGVVEYCRILNHHPYISICCISWRWNSSTIPM